MDINSNTKQVSQEIDFENRTGREINRKLREQKNNRIKEAHRRLDEKRKAARRAQPRRVGVARLSNTDTIARANQIRARLLAKLKEAFASDMEPRARDVFAADIKLRISQVDHTINAIRRRERAIEEERNINRRDDTPEDRRRRFREMQRRSISIRRDLLYHRDEGGFDPNMPQIGRKSITTAESAVLLLLGENAEPKEIPENMEDSPELYMGV